MDSCTDARPGDLDHNFSPVMQARGMNLGYRGGCEGLVGETGKHFFNGLPELLLDTPARQIRGKGRDLVLQPCKLDGNVVSQQIAARGEYLSELDKDGTQVFAGPAQPCPPAQFRCPVQTPRTDLQQQAGKPWQRKLENELIETIAGKDLQYAEQAYKRGEVHASGAS